MNIKRLFCGILIAHSGLLLMGCSMFGHRTEETPKYQVILKEENFEIREYSPYIQATTKVKGNFKESQGEAFRILAGYIFGQNEKQSKIAMTAPVVMNPKEATSEKISMTAPVIQSPLENGWQMSFSMPSKYKSIEELPQPKDSRVILQVVPSKLVAVISFSGFWSEEKNQSKANELKSWLEKSGQYETISLPQFAGYDPPWTIPIFRRNEMMIEVRKK